MCELLLISTICNSNVSMHNTQNYHSNTEWIKQRPKKPK